MSLAELLERLGVLPGSLVYLHTSFSRMAYLGLEPAAFIDRFLSYLGPQGTLVMPSFSWNLDRSARPWVGYRRYFESRPEFDVLRTPANIGVLPEVFRQLAGTHRSLSYWWSVAAVGALAEVITANQLQVEHPYGPDSSFDLLRQHNVVLVGLGVTLNTTSLAFVPDYSLNHRSFLSPQMQEGVVVDARGVRHASRSYWVLPEAVQRVKPETVFQRSAELRSRLRRHDRGDIIQFAYPYAAYHKEAIRLGQEALAEGRPVPWLEGLQLP